MVMRRGSNHAPHFCLDPPIPPCPTLGKNSLSASRGVKGDLTLRENGETLEDSIPSPALPPNKLRSLGQVVHLSGRRGPHVGSERPQPDGF